MSGRDVLTRYRLNFGQAALATLALHDFAFLLIAHVTGGGALDDDGTSAIRAECLKNLLNADVVGHPIGEKAEIVRIAVENVERLIDEAIHRGRQPQEP